MDRKLEKKRGITRKNIWYFLFGALMLAVQLVQAEPTFEAMALTVRRIATGPVTVRLNEGYGVIIAYPHVGE